MKLISKVILLIIVFISIAFFIQYQIKNNNQKIVYYKTFNTKNDIKQIKGGGKLSINNHALKIIGGCIQPSGAIEIPFDQKPGYYRLSLWAKSNLIGRSDIIMYWWTNKKKKYISYKQYSEELRSSLLWGIRENNPLFRVKVNIKNKWVYFETVNYLSKPESGQLMLEFDVGGFIAGGYMEIDKIKLEKIKYPNSERN